MYEGDARSYLAEHDAAVRAEALAEEEKTTPHGGAEVTPQPEFFQPGHGYTHRSYGNDFLCVTVTTHPMTGERLAMGWISEHGDWHRPAVVGINQWNHEYDGVEPPTSTPHPESGRARLDASTVAHAEATHWRRLGITPPKADPNADRLAILRTAITDWQGEWTTARAYHLYQARGIGNGQRGQARNDLKTLHAAGLLVLSDLAPEYRHYTFNSWNGSTR